MIKPTELRYIKKTNTLSITFEDGFKNSAPGRKDVEYSILEHGGASINTCTDGKCLLRTSTSSPFHLQDQQGMNSSSVMTWFRFEGKTAENIGPRQQKLVETNTNLTLPSARLVL